MLLVTLFSVEPEKTKIRYYIISNKALVSEKELGTEFIFIEIYT